MEDLTNIDLYELLDVPISASSQEIKKAYRKKALKCHPDKNPDNPKAAELFHQLSRALEVLTDESARSAYDKVINAKKAAALRNRELDAKRQKLKEELEERERQAQFVSTKEKSAEEKFRAEIERLRKEGSKQLEEEIEFVRQEVRKEKEEQADILDATHYRLKLNWQVSNSNNDNSYNEEMLKKVFLKYGEISALVLSKKKKGSALLEFASPSAAVKAHQFEKGFLSNPLTVNWLSGTPPGYKAVPKASDCCNVRNYQKNVPGSSIFPSMPSSSKPNVNLFPSFSSQPDILQKKKQEKLDEDFESMVLLRMRQAEQEKRINSTETEPQKVIESKDTIS